MSSVLLLQDYQIIPREWEDLCRDLQRRIDQGEQLLIDLLDDGSRDSQYVQIFRDNGKHLLVQQYVGLFEYNGERVVIGSRFDGGKNAFFLRYLLENCWNASLLLLDGLDSVYQHDIFDWLLVTKLALGLQQAWRKGALRQYRTFHYDDSRVRGTVDVTRHIRAHLGLESGKIAYGTRSYSLDNSYNALFLLASHAAGRKYPALLRRLRQRLPEFQAALQMLEREVSDWPSLSRRDALQRTGKKITNPLYRNYEAARITARAILRRLGADPFGSEGQVRQVTGIFLDMNALWEQFLVKTLFAGVSENFLQRSQDILGGHMTVRPDFLWPDKGIVLDGKYQRVWADTLPLDGKWSEQLTREAQKAVKEDVYQVLSYMLIHGCTNGGVIFPIRCHQKHCLFSPVSDPVGPAGQRFWRVPVPIPAAGDYGEFVARMNEEVNRLRRLAIIRRILT